MVDGAINEALNKVTKDYLDVNVDQKKYSYVADLVDHGDKDLALTVLNSPRFPLLDYVILSPKVLIPRVVLDWPIDENEDYGR